MDLLFVYDIEDRVGYAREHEKELEFAMFNDVMFYARQSQVDSRLDLFVFSHSPEDVEPVAIKQVTLVTQDGTVVWDKDIQATLMPISIGELYQESSAEREFDYAVTIVEYDQTASWYYDGSNLTLTVEVECGGEVIEIAYPVYVHSYWDISFYF